MKILKRIGWGVGILILVLVVFLFGSIIVDGFFSQGRLEPLTNMSVTAPDGTEIRAYLAKPEGDGPFPAVIMIHEFWGIREDMLGKAEALADEGYVVIAPNVFRNGTTNWLPSAIYKVIIADSAQIDSDVDAVYQWLTTQPEVQADRVAIMGFCFGGGTALRYSTENNQLAGTAVFYGQIISDPEQLKTISGPVLGIFAGDDVSISQENVAALAQGLDAAAVPNEIKVYAGQPHAFVGSIEDINAGGADQEAWQQLLAFLQRTLKEGPGSASIAPKPITVSIGGEHSIRYLVGLILGHMGHM